MAEGVEESETRGSYVLEMIDDVTIDTPGSVGCLINAKVRHEYSDQCSFA